VIAEVVSATSVWVEQDATLLSYARTASAISLVGTANADGTYGAEEATLINEIKANFNALLVALQNAGIVKP